MSLFVSFHLHLSPEVGPPDPDLSDNSDQSDSPDHSDPHRESINRSIEEGLTLLKRAADGVQEPEVVWNYRNMRNSNQETLRKVNDLTRQVSRARGEFWRSLSLGEGDKGIRDQLSGLETELKRAIDRARDTKSILDRLTPSYQESIRESVESERKSLLEKVREEKRRAEETLAVCESLENYFGMGWESGIVDLERLESVSSVPSI